MVSYFFLISIVFTLKILDKYILKQFLVAFFFAISILAVVSCVVDYSEKVDAFVKNKAPIIEILKYFMAFIPHIIALLYPLFIFVSTIFFTSKLAYRSEFIAMQASGIPLRRILRPYWIGSILIGLVSLAFNHFLVPMADQNLYAFEEKFVRGEKKTTDMDVHIRLLPQQFVYCMKFDLERNNGQLFTEENFEGTLLTKKIFAENVSYIDSSKTWVLKTVMIRTNDGLKEKIEKVDSLHRHYKLKPQDFTEDIQRKSAMTTPEIYAKTDLEQSRGLENLQAYAYEMHRRTADSVAGIILTLIAVAIASRKIRGGSGLHLAIGIVISAIFLLFMQFSKTFAINTGLSPLLAAWIPNIIFSVVAYYLYWKQKR